MWQFVLITLPLLNILQMKRIQRVGQLLAPPDAVGNGLQRRRLPVPRRVVIPVEPGGWLLQLGLLERNCEKNQIA